MTAATLIANAEPAAPEIADAIMAEAMGETSAQASRRKPTFAERVAAFYEVERERAPLKAEAQKAADEFAKAKAEDEETMKAASDAVPLPAALVVPNTNSSIVGGEIRYADGKRHDLTPPTTIELRTHADLNAYMNRNPDADYDALRTALGDWHVAQFRAGCAAAPRIVEANAAHERAASFVRPLTRKRDRLFEAIIRHKAADLAELFQQLQVLATYTGARVRKNGSAAFGSQLFLHDLEISKLLGRMTELMAPPRAAKAKQVDEVAELAAVDFEPVMERGDALRVGSELDALFAQAAPMLRLSMMNMTHTRSGLAQVLSNIGKDEPDAPMVLVEDITEAASMFRTWAETCEIGRARAVVALASLACEGEA